MPSDKHKSKAQLYVELNALRLRVAELETARSGSNDSQQALGERVEYIRDLIDGSIVMVQNIDLDGKFIFVNRAWRETMGYSEAELEALSFFSILHPGSMNLFQESFARVISGKCEYTHNIEAVFLAKGGREVIVEGDLGPHHQGGKTLGVLGFFRDISRHKRAEEALRQSESRLELALESAGLGLWDQNLKNGEVIRNRRWAEMLGYTLEELGTSVQSWKDLIHPDDLPLVNRIAKDHEEGRIPFFKVEHRLKTKTGEWKWILNWGKVVERDENGRPLRATGTHLDITERKREEEERLKLEAMIQQAQKFESLNVMAGSIAHNFNNLLMVVLGNLELALDSLQADPSQRQNIENAEKAARHAAELSTLMLTYVGQTRVNMQLIDMSELVEEMIEVLELALAKKSTLRFNPSPGPVFFKGDRSQIRQLIMNLVTNAAEAVGDAEGTISLTTGTVFCDPTCFQQPFISDSLPEGNYAYLDVSDTGCGMDEDTLARVFDPFFTTKFQGRGLGMAVVLGIVRTHRGAVSLDSQPGRGTTVRILFSALDVPKKAQAQTQLEMSGWRHHGTVLLVDDEEAVLDVARRMLEHLGFDVLTAPGGPEAIEMYREQGDDIHIVLLDLTMPHLNGVEAFYELQRIKKNVRVILASGFTEEKASKLCHSDLPAGFIQKPFNLANLAAKLKEVLESTKE